MLYASPAITAYVLVAVGLFGLAMGSFINCWAWRSTHGESVLRGRSHCTSCGRELAARDLVPVFSWLASKGACRYCGQKVSARYPVTELLCAGVFVGIVAAYGLTLEAAQLLVFTAALLFLSLTDIDDYLIPNGCIVVALAARVAYLAAAYALGEVTLADIGYFAASGFGMGAVLVVIVLVADKVFGRESMGGGDLKLYSIAGLYFGWQQGLFVVILSCVIGIVVAFVTAPASREETEKAEPSDSPARPEGAQATPEDSALRRVIPFGPSIAAACVVALFAGQPLVSWYFSLLG